MAKRYVQVIKNMLTKAEDSGQDLYLVMLEATIYHKIYETNSSFHVKQRFMEKA